MVRIFLSIVIFLSFTSLLFSETKDNSGDKFSFINPYVSFSNSNSANISPQKPNNLPGLDSISFSLYVDSGIIFDINDYVSITPILALDDLSFNLDTNASGYTFNYNNFLFSNGVNIDIYPVDFFYFTHSIQNIEKIDLNKNIWSGFRTGLDLVFTFEKANLNFSFNDQIDLLYQQKYNNKIDNYFLVTSFENNFSYSFDFYFLNFIKKDINTGFVVNGSIYTQDFFSTNYKYKTNFSDTQTFQTNLFAGFSTNPIEYFQASLGFVLNYQYNNTGSLTASQEAFTGDNTKSNSKVLTPLKKLKKQKNSSNDIITTGTDIGFSVTVGIKAGYGGFSVTYSPYFWNDQGSSISHTVTLSGNIKLKKK